MDIHEYDTVKTLVEKGGFPVDAVTFSPDELEFLF